MLHFTVEEAREKDSYLRIEQKKKKNPIKTQLGDLQTPTHMRKAREEASGVLTRWHKPSAATGSPAPAGRGGRGAPRQPGEDGAAERTLRRSRRCGRPGKPLGRLLLHETRISVRRRNLTKRNETIWQQSPMVNKASVCQLGRGPRSVGPAEPQQRVWKSSGTRPGRCSTGHCAGREPAGRHGLASPWPRAGNRPCQGGVA